MMTTENKSVTKALAINSQSGTDSTTAQPVSPINDILNQKLTPINLKEKFLFATYEIIAEKGPEGLSASELIKRTQSSKGALFHHFKTLDELCLASLLHFKDYTKNTLKLPKTENLSAFLHAFAEDSRRRQCRVDYFHLCHFFRDKAIRDPRFRTVMAEANETYTTMARDLILPHLSPAYDAQKAMKITRFFIMSLERIFYQSVMFAQPTVVDEQLVLLLKSVEDLFKS